MPFDSAEADGAHFQWDVALSRQNPPQFQSYRLEYHCIPWTSDSDQEEDDSEKETEPDQHLGQYEGEVFGCDNSSGEGGIRIGYIKFVKIDGEDIYGMGHTLWWVALVTTSWKRLTGSRDACDAHSQELADMYRVLFGKPNSRAAFEAEEEFGDGYREDVAICYISQVGSKHDQDNLALAPGPHVTFRSSFTSALITRFTPTKWVVVAGWYGIDLRSVGNHTK